jgi:protein RecA
MEREKALEMAMAQIEKQFGKGSVMRMGEVTTMGMEAVSTGALALDLALGIGGLPKGRVVEIYGPESSGKSTLAMHLVAEAQRMGGICAYIDAEHAMDPVYAKAIGVDIDELLISQPDTGEQALEICDMLVRSGAIDVVVIDSVAALTPRAEIEGDMGDTHVGLQARLMSQALRKLTGNLSKTNTICLFINQLREKIGVMFGSPETTPGGRALKFYASVRLDIRRIESIKDGVEVVGNRTRVKVVKNKCLAAGTMVLDPTTGDLLRIEDIVERGRGTSVLAIDADERLHVRAITGRYNQGPQQVLGLRLDNGSELWCTPDHPILTPFGWVQAGELDVRSAVATAELASFRVVDALAKHPVGAGRLAKVEPSLVPPRASYQFVVEIREPEVRQTYDLEVQELHTFVANGFVVHNCSAPFRQAEFDIMYGKGISREGSVLDVAVDLDICKKSGAWYTYEGEQLGQGRENAKVFLAENPSVMIEIYDRVRQDAGITKEGLHAPIGAQDAQADPDDEPISLD